MAAIGSNGAQLTSSATSWTSVSDERLKYNIGAYDHPSEDTQKSMLTTAQSV